MTRSSLASFALAVAREESDLSSIPEIDTEGLGARLRHAREAKRATLAEIADAAGLTKGFLSKVERDLATPSVASLLRLCDALGASIGELFDGTPAQALVRADAYPAISFGGAGMVESLLTPTREGRLQVIHSVIRPSGGSGPEPYAIPAEVEFVLVLGGELELAVDDATYRLTAGDALTFSPRAPHTFTNPREDEDTVVVWVLTPALPTDHPREPAEDAAP